MWISQKWIGLFFGMSFYFDQYAWSKNKTTFRAGEYFANIYRFSLVGQKLCYILILSSPTFQHATKYSSNFTKYNPKL